MQATGSLKRSSVDRSANSLPTARKMAWSMPGAATDHTSGNRPSATNPMARSYSIISARSTELQI